MDDRLKTAICEAFNGARYGGGMLASRTAIVRTVDMHRQRAGDGADLDWTALAIDLIRNLARTSDGIQCAYASHMGTCVPAIAFEPEEAAG